MGNYTIYERVPPEYHLLDEERVKQVTMKYGETAEVDFENEPYGDLRIEKVDGATGASLAGARIQVKHIESGATYTGITGTGGSYTFTELKPGAYEIRELSAPEGWQRDPQTCYHHCGSRGLRHLQPEERGPARPEDYQVRPPEP